MRWNKRFEHSFFLNDRCGFDLKKINQNSGQREYFISINLRLAPNF